MTHMPAATQNTSDSLYEVRRSNIDGSGAFALKNIPKGTRIDEYVGERISNAEADKRYRDHEMETHHTWLFALDGNITIDAAVGGSDSRFINHSCDPNCEAIEEKGRIFIYSLRAIPKGTELAYDYAYARDDDDEDEEEWERFYACRCGSPKCRGTILAPKKPKKAPAKLKTAAVAKAKTKTKATAKTKTKTKTKATAKTKVTAKTKAKAKAKSKVAAKTKAPAKTKAKAPTKTKTKTKTKAKAKRR
jgi:hypothetical protein